MDYRRLLFDNYATRGTQRALTFDPAAAERWGRIYDSYLEGWLPPRKDAAIVDLACGNGNLLHFLLHRGFTNVQGVDISAEQAELSKQVTHRVTQQSAQEFLAASKGSVDTFIALDIIEHLGKDEVLEVLTACHRIMAPGARIILQTPNGDSPWSNSVRYGDFTHETCFTPGSLSWLLALVGFTSIEPRAAGPRSASLSSTVRTVVWKGIVGGLKLWNLAETGSVGSGIYTRVFLISAVKE